MKKYLLRKHDWGMIYEVSCSFSGSICIHRDRLDRYVASAIHILYIHTIDIFRSIVIPKETNNK